MTLNDEQVRKIILKNPQKDLITELRKESNMLRMHCTGNGIDKFIDSIPYFEREELKRERIKMARSNRDLVIRTMQPRDKIYTAKGGIEQYTITPEAAEPEFRDYLSEIGQGLPLNEWVRQRVQKMYDYDPNGMVFIDVDEDDNPYPCLKSINEIFYRVLSGRKVECVFFEIGVEQIEAYTEAGVLSGLQKTDKVFRIIDDMQDRLCVRTAKANATDGIRIISIPNPFLTTVPAIVISDIWSDTDGIFQSPLSGVVELLNAALFAGSTYNIAYARQAYPKEWMQQFDCPTCSGDKIINGGQCPECKGQGILVSMRVADTLVVDFRGEGGKNIPNPPMGRVDTPVEGLQFMRENGDLIEDKVNYTIWGVTRVAPTSGTAKVSGHGSNVSNTAYEAQLNTQPQHDKLKIFGAWRAGIMTFVANLCGLYKYGNGYKGAAILSGDRFMIESPDATWDRYSKAAATDKTPDSVLDSLLQEYIENKYNNNPVLYRKFMLLMQVEPFVHKAYSEIATYPTVPEIQKMEKLYFDEWTSTLTDYDIAMVGDNGADELRVMLRDYVTGKYQADKQYDTLLFTSQGEILAIGDQVQVVEGKEQQPEHIGRTFSVDYISGDNVSLKDDTGIVQGYTKSDISRVSVGQAA